MLWLAQEAPKEGGKGGSSEIFSLTSGSYVKCRAKYKFHAHTSQTGSVPSRAGEEKKETSREHLEGNQQGKQV